MKPLALATKTKLHEMKRQLGASLPTGHLVLVVDFGPNQFAAFQDCCWCLLIFKAFGFLCLPSCERQEGVLEKWLVDKSSQSLLYYYISAAKFLKECGKNASFILFIVVSDVVANICSSGIIVGCVFSQSISRLNVDTFSQTQGDPGNTTPPLRPIGPRTFLLRDSCANCAVVLI